MAASGLISSAQLIISDVLDDMNVVGFYLLLNMAISRAVPFLPPGIPMGSEIVGATRRLAEQIIFHRFAATKIRGYIGIPDSK